MHAGEDDTPEHPGEGLERASFPVGGSAELRAHHRLHEAHRRGRDRRVQPDPGRPTTLETVVVSSEDSVEISAPIAAAYAIVSDFSVFPRFLRGVGAVRELDDGTLEFTTDSPDDVRRWPAVVTERSPGVSVAWTSRGAVAHSGVITLEAVSAERTLVTLRIDHDAGTGLPDDTTADLVVLEDIARSLPARPGVARIASLTAVTQSRATDTLGEPLGALLDAYVDLDSNLITAIAVSVGASEAPRLVPIRPTPIDEVVRGVRLPFPAEMIHGAPTVEPGIEPSASQLERAERHFADPASWMTAREALRERQATPPPVPGIAGIFDEAGEHPSVPAPTPEIAELDLRDGDRSDR